MNIPIVYSSNAGLITKHMIQNSQRLYEQEQNQLHIHAIFLKLIIIWSLVYLICQNSSYKVTMTV